MVDIEPGRISGKGGDPMSLLKSLLDHLTTYGARCSKNDEFHEVVS